MLAAAIVISLLVLASLTADRDHGSGPLRSEAFGAGQEAPLRPLISASGAAAPRTSRRRPAPRSHPAYRLLHGVDVSHWNHSIRWKRVRASGQTFAIMKATEGRKQVDRTYARNRRRAMRAGMIVAAYHFAIPDRRPRDAIIEANHFLRVAHVRAGDIVPVLDLETNEGLSHRALIAWTRQWLQDVYRRTEGHHLHRRSPVEDRDAQHGEVRADGLSAVGRELEPAGAVDSGAQLGGPRLDVLATRRVRARARDQEVR